VSEVTRLLDAVSRGNHHAAADLLPLIYAELRRLAAQKLNHEPPGQTLQPTALVHEAYCRLVGAAVESNWSGRGHFFAAAGKAMRHILIDLARRKHSKKHGGGMVRRELSEDLLVASEPCEDLLALDDALEKMKTVDAVAAELVQLRYFAGLTLDEAAEILGMSSRSAGRKWQYARAWLRDAVENSLRS
jgi:RNA polymerase sigma factor (TIGR02999 family)